MNPVSMPVNRMIAAPVDARRDTASSSIAAMASGSVPGRITSLPPAQSEITIGAQRDSRLDLVRDDLGDELSAYREVRVSELVDL